MVNHLSCLLISILLLESLRAASADEELVDAVCDQAPPSEICRSVLLSDSRSLQAKSPTDLALVALDVTINDATAASRNAAFLAGQFTGAPQEEPISRCMQLYLILMVDLRDVMSMIKSSAFEEAYQATLDVRRIPDACDNEFASRRLSSLLSTRNKDLDQKIALCVNLTYQMVGGPRQFDQPDRSGCTETCH